MVISFEVTYVGCSIGVVNTKINVMIIVNKLGINYTFCSGNEFLSKIR